nr:hypothetical protein [Tanacetum cinerariifolium]
MQILGFSTQWCRWINAGCVSSRASILVNGSPTSEFSLKRGLRQGDPLSPFLFIMVMEASGLKININKSDLYGVRVSSEEVTQMVEAPEALINLLESLYASFFWGASGDKKKTAWIKWSNILASHDRGLGVGSLKAFNMSLLLKWRWRLLNHPYALWVKVVKAIHGEEVGFELLGSQSSGIWARIEMSLFVLASIVYFISTEIRIASLNTVMLMVIGLGIGIGIYMEIKERKGLNEFKSLGTRQSWWLVDSHRGQLDVKTAFFHGNLKEVIYMRQPPRYEQDDMLIAYKSKAKIGSTKSFLKRGFDMKDLREAKKILSMEIVRDRSRKILRVSQSGYISKILNNFRIDNGKSVQIPLGGHFKLSLKDFPIRDCDVERMSKVPFANTVGSLMYLMVCTRPDIAYAVSIVSRYLANSDYAKDPDKGRSITGYAFLVQGCVVSWNETLQHVVAHSTTKAEYMALTEAVNEAIWLKGLLEEL